MHARALALGIAVWLAQAAVAQTITGARYAQPVERYGHFALGRPHEYSRVIAVIDDGRELTLELPADEVLEDLAPRLVRLGARTPPQLLVIVSRRGEGSQLALIGLRGGQLEFVARSAPIGVANRWLNPVGVADLDGDGVAEIAAVTTPHIGGVLRVYRRDGPRLVEVDAAAGFSNHVYGSEQLGLSTPASVAGRMLLLVPDARRTRIRAMALVDDRLVEAGDCPLAEPLTGPAPLAACAARLAR